MHEKTIVPVLVKSHVKTMDEPHNWPGDATLVLIIG